VGCGFDIGGAGGMFVVFVIRSRSTCIKLINRCPNLLKKAFFCILTYFGCILSFNHLPGGNLQSSDIYLPLRVIQRPLQGVLKAEECSSNNDQSQALLREWSYRSLPL
jgi:hypothetical protein